MCFDAESSRNAFILNFMLSTILLFGNSLDKWVAFFSISFSLIQLLEYKIWSSTTEEENMKWTSLVEPALWLQTIVQTGSAIWATKENTTILQILLSIMIYKFFTTKPSKDKSYKGKGGHLVWYNDDAKGVFGNSTSGLIYLAGLFIPLYLGLPSTLWSLMYGTFSFAFLYNKYNATQEFSSMWCIYGTLYPLVRLISR